MNSSFVNLNTLSCCYMNSASLVSVDLLTFIQLLYITMIIYFGSVHLSIFNSPLWWSTNRFIQLITCFSLQFFILHRKYSLKLSVLSFMHCIVISIMMLFIRGMRMILKIQEPTDLRTPSASICWYRTFSIIFDND